MLIGLSTLRGVFFRFRRAFLEMEIGRWDDERALRRCLGFAIS